MSIATNRLNGTNGHNGHSQQANGHSRIVLPEERLPPQNIECEEGVIGSILLDNEVYHEVKDFLEISHFYRDSHRVIFRRIKDLLDSGTPCDSLLLEESLTRHGELEDIGGLDTILKILGSVPHAAHGRYYAQVVVEKAVARDLIQVANDTLTDAYSNNFTAEDLLAKTETQIARFSIHKKTNKQITVANIGDVRAVAGEQKWLWEGWMHENHIALLAAEPGTGKTRLAADLCARMWYANPWPCGQLASRPRGTPSLWVPSDRNYSELAAVAREWGLPDEAMYVNAQICDPLGGITLDNSREVADLAERVAMVQPGLIVIDTINKATGGNLYRPEDAERFFGPLIDLAVRSKATILALTHLSKGGEPLDRRVLGHVRTMWKMTGVPGDVETSKRRRLWVAKTNSMTPDVIDFEHQTGCIHVGSKSDDYTKNDQPAPPVLSKADRAYEIAKNWLKEYLETGPALCTNTKLDAQKMGIKLGTFDRARKELEVITEGTKQKYYRLPETE